MEEWQKGKTDTPQPSDETSTDENRLKWDHEVDGPRCEIIGDTDMGYAYPTYEEIIYFKGDDTFVDSHEEVIDNIQELIGVDAEEKVVGGEELFVQNNEFQIIYEVSIDKRSSSKALYGEDDTQDNTPLSPSERAKKMAKDDDGDEE